MTARDKKRQAAVQQNRIDRVEELLDAGADPDTEGPFGALLIKQKAMPT
jgi:hypothetical protein